MSQLEVRVSAARSRPSLKAANDIVLAKVKTVEGLADVTSNLSEGRPSATIVVDQAKAAAAGVTPATLSQYTTLVLNGYPLGTVPTTAGDAAGAAHGRARSPCRRCPAPSARC